VETKLRIDRQTHAARSAQTWVVIAAYNESGRIDRVLRELRERDVQVVVVDDGSRDDTADCAAAANVWVLRHLVNRGQGAALRTGIRFALSKGAMEIVTFDGDGQHQASDLPTLLSPIRQGEADLVIGSRFLGQAPGMPWLRRMLLKAAVLFTRLTTGLELTDAHNGLRAMTREAAVQLNYSEDGMAHASQILSLAARNHLRVAEVPCTIQYTDETLSKGQKNDAAFHILSRLTIARVLR
jgi:glycosyltransferase involved in cell wall biosynthesis